MQAGMNKTEIKRNETLQFPKLMSHPNKETDSSVVSQNHEQMRKKIIEVATKAFHSEGVRPVTMDDIAHKMGMSKRTLYQLFADKEDLLLSCVTEHEKQDRLRVEEEAKQASNVLEFIIMEFQRKLRDLERITPAFLTEVVRYPKVMEFYRTRHCENADMAVEFLEKGVEQGYFRPEIDFRIVYDMLQSNLEFYQRNPKIFKKYSFSHVFRNTVLVFFRGCTTPEGCAFMDEYMKTFDDKEGKR